METGSALAVCFSIVEYSWSSNSIHYTRRTKGRICCGNIARDIGLDISDIANRKLRISSDSSTQYFSVDTRNGELTVNGRIDREALCGQSASCVMPLQLVIENPLQLYRVNIEIKDINDNAPNFHTKDSILKIAESVVVGANISNRKCRGFRCR